MKNVIDGKNDMDERSNVNEKGDMNEKSDMNEKGDMNEKSDMNINDDINVSNELVIRTASVSDAPDLLEIYRPYVESTAISFEYETPSAEEFRKRVETTLRRYPYLVAVSGNEIIGYAYASAFKGRKAYDWAVEVSIYLKQGHGAKGYGRQLYLALEDLLAKQHIINLNACITYAEPEDEYTNDHSMKFHKRMGYQFVGKFSKCGYKFGRWYDVVWMEKMIGEHTERPEPVILFGEL